MGWAMAAGDAGVCRDDCAVIAGAAVEVGGRALWSQLEALEGMNNKVKTVSHRAYGFRSTATYITGIWHGCANLPLP